MRGRGRFDVIWPRRWTGCRATRRISRASSSMAFAGVKIVTLSEGEVTHLHIGLKGTMNALFLKDLADKTRRGQRGRVEMGRSGGGNCYGYTVVRRIDAVGEPVRGERTIDPVEAEVIRRIFRDYAAGKSPKRHRDRAQCRRHLRADRRGVGLQHHQRERQARHRHPQQRALHRAAGLEPPALRQGPGYGQARQARPNPPEGLGDPGGAGAAHRR
jgi:hypothetical protein